MRQTGPYRLIVIKQNLRKTFICKENGWKCAEYAPSGLNVIAFPRSIFRKIIIRYLMRPYRPARQQAAGLSLTFIAAWPSVRWIEVIKGRTEQFLSSCSFGVCLAESGFSVEYIVENSGLTTSWFSVAFFLVFTMNVFSSSSCSFLWKYSVETCDLSRYSRPVVAVDQTFLWQWQVLRSVDV